jgi:hypothetical protein
MNFNDCQEKINNALINYGIYPRRKQCPKGKKGNKCRARLASYQNNGEEDKEIDFLSVTKCDSACKEKKRQQQLLAIKYQGAKTNVKTAPSKLDVAEKNYYVGIYGQSEYNDLLLERYSNEINEISINEKNIFNGQKENMLLLLEYYEKNILLNEKINVLIKKNITENNILINKIDDIISRRNTNERVIHYDDQQLQNVKKWKKYNLYFLIFIYITLFSLLLIFRRDLLSYKIILLFIVLLIIPLFLIPSITRLILSLYNWIGDDTSNMGVNQLLYKILLEMSDELKIFFGIFAAPIEFLAL